MRSRKTPMRGSFWPVSVVRASSSPGSPVPSPPAAGETGELAALPASVSLLPVDFTPVTRVPVEAEIGTSAGPSQTRRRRREEGTGGSSEAVQIPVAGFEDCPACSVFLNKLLRMKDDRDRVRAELDVCLRRMREAEEHRSPGAELARRLEKALVADRQAHDQLREEVRALMARLDTSVDPAFLRGGKMPLRLLRQYGYVSQAVLESCGLSGYLQDD